MSLKDLTKQQADTITEIDFVILNALNILRGSLKRVKAMLTHVKNLSDFEPIAV